ncbi:MAG TPA: flagellar basal body P-ring formation chaperone FlgA [Trinickia sp.]|uniref:flagellar basal body P-ring formation chaperone FlgA n=1 Tax=Trinickia sp. TaxID=2571163 RepID=UPI002C02C5BC|nr:flagellar basal body P-ring formation chaperone FlgA [Trinickia sp.]HVW53200.1 flagellar basal body P-ring formation chaperone FlgA [Trinickia sp.]
MSVSAASDLARHQAPRALGRRHAAVSRLARAALCALAAALALPGAAAYAQSADANGQIYIPGPGETRGATSSGMISIPGPGEAHAATAHANGAETNAMIVIPGPGEAQPGAQAAAPQRIGVPQHPTPSARNAAVAAAPASGRAIPVVVTAPQRAVRTVQPIAVEPAAHAGLAAPLAATSGTPRVQAVAAAAPAPAAVAATAPAPAATAPAGQEDGETIRRAALAYLQQQTVGLPGKIAITVRQTFPRGLAACTTLEPFMPTGARLWGRTTVGVRCAGAKPWTLYLQAQISIEATYYLAARQIEPGAVVTAEDLLARNGDLSNLPRAIITDPSQAVGAVALARISAGMPLRQDLLKSASAVSIGQTVRVVAKGQDFTISSEGSVMNNASPGQQVRVKMAGGQIISGIVKDGATVQVQM